MKSLGICIGASTLSAVELQRLDGGEIREGFVFRSAHAGNPRAAVRSVLDRHLPGDGCRIALTGRKFRGLLNLTSIPEPEAVEQALRASAHVNGPVEAVVSAGGETFMVYRIGRDGRICGINTGNKCASGTGEFFLQQIRRLGLDLTEAVSLARTDDPYRVSGRCSVFCKSDCTHAANKGIPKGRITAGLCQMMAGKILELLRQTARENILLVGGVAGNEVLLDLLRREIRNVLVPPQAPYFEAWGAALWALENDTAALPRGDSLFRAEHRSFHYLRPLADSGTRVDFRDNGTGGPASGGETVLGLDVGSTTTKAVILEVAGNRILASVYLRTGGDPVAACRACYAELARQTAGAPLRITGLGVTGSGRQIAALHAGTGGIVNEIIAHATAARFYDPEVDTLFEIGGQDAKYTHLVNGVPMDYAMNDACSAGTGSFLEESALETLGVGMEDIAPLALGGSRPPNFNDQCAAFISSDIKNALHEGIGREDILAGLVYSIAMNYDVRVKGNRPVGRRVFMQGGVCYNRAVPLAMAALTGRDIVVPPDPGLMGAFGVALEVVDRRRKGLLPPGEYRLEDLRDRDFRHEAPFVCRGGSKERCDRKCEIARIRIGGTVFPFGGACNRWYNVRTRRRDTEGTPNLAAVYEERLHRAGTPPPEAAARRGTVGINRSFHVHACAPLYRRFFRRLGFAPVLPEKPEPEGTEARGAAFCYPAELAHGFFLDLLRREPDVLFLPHVRGLPAPAGVPRSTTCPVTQAEPYVLAAAFGEHPVFRRLQAENRILSPLLDFSGGWGSAEEDFVRLGKGLGASARNSRRAFREALEEQRRTTEDLAEEGRKFLEDLEAQPDRFAVVLLGRTYNTCVPEAHLSIPQKFATRGIPVIPCEMLPAGDIPPDPDMYWSAGQTILKAARRIREHPQLFGCYIMNFSCGPDSFLLGDARRIMGRKPFLVLELDSHTADAGLETRIEAFLDIVANVRSAGEEVRRRPVPVSRPARWDGKQQSFVDSRGRPRSLTDPSVRVVFPSMGRFLSEAGAAVFRGLGVRAEAMPPAGGEILQLGRGETTCKECLPLLLTTGTLLQAVRERSSPDELLVYFMPTAGGPCRFGRYAPFMNGLIRQQGWENVAILSLTSEDSYTGLAESGAFHRLWLGAVTADIGQDIRSVLLAAADDRERALSIFEREWQQILLALEREKTAAGITESMAGVAERLGRIALRRPLGEIPVILLTGEIFVRHDDLSRQFLVERLAEEGFAVKVASALEWVYYTDWCLRHGIGKDRPGLRRRLSLAARGTVMGKAERSLKAVMAGSGLYAFHGEDVRAAIESARPHLDPRLTGEAILTIGGCLHDVPGRACGAIAIGPFGCMPNRIAEAILSRRMPPLPFLAIESDGTPFPQLTDARLEAFLLQARRVHRQRLRGR
jgi:predicted CoA-substrate-specific enzyme activase